MLIHAYLRGPQARNGRRSFLTLHSIPFPSETAEFDSELLNGVIPNSNYVLSIFERDGPIIYNLTGF